jgi:cytidylate kinase
MNENIIAIDGPAGSGKSSVAREIAGQTDFYYMDSGSYYRAVTLYLFRIFSKSIDSKIFSDWISSQNIDDYLNHIQLDSQFSKTGENITLLNKEDVSQEIRSPQITEEIKHLASLLQVRSLVNKNLYHLSNSYKIIMDGRDIGTEVFPDAKLKFFLTADPKIRAKRRWEEYKEKGILKNLDELEVEIIRRDESDRNRKIAPLRKAEDAILIDTSNLSKIIVINMILSRL